MKKTLIILVLFLTYNITLAQIPENDYYRQKYFSNFNTYPDSSYYYGSKLVKNLKQEPDSIKAKDFHNFAIYFLYANQKDSTVYYLNKSLHYGNKGNNIKTNITLAGFYKKNGDYIDAKKIFIALLKDTLTQRDLGICHSELGSLYSLSDDFEKAKFHFEKGIAILSKNNEYTPLAICQENFGNFYKKNNLPNKALPLLLKSKDYFKETKDWRQYYLCEINTSYCYYFISDLKKAKESLSNIKEEELIKLNDKFILASYYNLSALLGKAQKEELFSKSISIATSNKDPETFTYINEYLKLLIKENDKRGISELLESNNIDSIYKQGNLFEKTEYLKIVTATDLNKEETASQLRELLTLTDSLRNEQGKVFSDELNLTIVKLREKEKESLLFKRNKKIFIALIILMTLVGIYFLIRMKKKIKKTKKSLEQEKDTIQTDLNLKITKSKSKRITATKKAIELDLINIKLTEELQKFKKDLTSETSKEVLDSHWKKFIERFNLMNPEFSEKLKLKFPKLTKSDIELCSLLKLNLSNKEIAQILNIEYRSVIVKKQRLKKKLNLDSNSDLETFIFSYQIID